MNKPCFEIQTFLRDQRKFSEFYDRVERSLRAFFELRVRSRSVTEDLFQETFKKFWRQLKQQNDLAGNPAIFLFTCARSVLLDYFKKYKRKQNAMEVARSSLEAKSSESPLEKEISGERAKALRYSQTAPGALTCAAGWAIRSNLSGRPI